MYLSSYCTVGFEVSTINTVTIYSLLINGCPKQALEQKIIMIGYVILQFNKKASMKTETSIKKRAGR